MREVLGVVDIDRRERGTEQHLTDFVRRAEPGPGLHNDAARTIRQVTPAIVDGLGKPNHRGQGNVRRGYRTARLLQFAKYHPSRVSNRPAVAVCQVPSDYEYPRIR